MSAALIEPIREASRQLVRELGFLRPTLAQTALPPSVVHAVIELGQPDPLTARALAGRLGLEKSSVSRLLRKLVEAGLVAEAASPGDGRAKLLSLTPDGAALLARVHGFARRQVADALAQLAPAAQQQVLDGLTAYAGALRRSAPVPPAAIEIRSGYQPGVLGRLVSLQAAHYAAAAGFGQVFESLLARGLAEFAGRLGQGPNGLWTAWRAGEAAALGGIAIDGEDLNAGATGDRRAHLRWFILADAARGSGTGRRLLQAALDFCDAQGFRETELWTFRGLDAARRLYEAAGFTLVEERPGDQWGSTVTEQRFLRPCP